MPYAPSAAWTTAIASQTQTPIYFLRISGITVDFATASVKSAGTTKLVCMDPPSGGGMTLDLLDGHVSQSALRVELLDVDDAITDYVSTDAPGAAVSTLINRTATLYGGYAHLTEAEYPAIYTGVISSLEMNDELTGYLIGIRSVLDNIRGKIMTGATADTPATVRGNPVNLYWSILTGTFSTSHGTFPLSSVSVADTSSSAPTGLSISTASINTTQLTDERDRWYANDIVECVYTNDTDGRSHLEREFFRVFGAFPTVSGGGLIGLRFALPPIPYSSALELTDTDHIVSIDGWSREFDQHLNRFTYAAELVKGSDEFDDPLYSTQTADDTADQAATGETIELAVDSKWLSRTYGGVETADTLAGRSRMMWLRTPATIQCAVNFTRRNVEHGDFVAVTARHVPDLARGVRGITQHMMLVTSVSPDFARGVLKLTLLDTGYKRYGGIAPAGQANYTGSTTGAQETFVFIGSATTNTMSTGDPGYRLL